MPDEPKQNMDEQLQAFARQRREAAGASFELASAARERLQSEVERTYSRSRSASEEPGLIGWLAGFGFRFAVGTVAFVALALTTVFWLPGLIAPRVELARQSAASQSESRIERQSVESKQETSLRSLSEIDSPVTPGADSARPSEFFRESNANRAKRDAALSLTPSRDTLALVPQVQPESLAGSPRERSPSEKSDSVSLTLRAPEAPTPPAIIDAPTPASAPAPQLADTKSSPAAAPAVASANARGPSVALESEPSVRSDSSTALGATKQARFAFGNEGAVTTLRDENSDRKNTEIQWSFQQTLTRANYRRNFNSPPVPQILNSFQVQQIGANLRVTDADGSVYEGAFDPTPNVGQTATAMSSLAERSRAAGRGGRGGFARPTSNESVTPQAAPTSGLEVGRNFRVAGTNRTLNQLVIINGQFQMPTNLQQDAFVRGVDSNAAPNGRLELQGTAKVGQSTEIPVRAFGQGP